MAGNCTHMDGIRDVTPSALGCEECLRSGDVWLQTFLAKVTTYKTTPPIRDLPRTVAHLRHERDVTLGSMIDAGFAAMLMLLSAVDEGLGALFFGIPPPVIPSVREAFGVPDEYTPIGAVAVGRRGRDAGSAGSAATRPRRPLEEIVHRGQW